MPIESEFLGLLERLRRGDEAAALEIVRRYETAIRVVIRTRLSDPRLRRQFDSMDVCQSVLASFFLHLVGGAYDLNEPTQLAALLTKMAQNKLAMRIRHECRHRRDARRSQPLGDEKRDVAGRVATPLRQLEARELLHQALEKMSAEVRAIADLRIRGQAWGEIAATLGGSADARRKQFERAIDRIAKDLNIDWKD